MQRTEFFQTVRAWSIAEKQSLFVHIFLQSNISEDKLIEAINAIASDNEINGALAKMGRSERIT